MPLKFAYLGAWHSHASMHVREAAQRPDEFHLVGMYDPDPEVIARNQQRWAEFNLPLSVFPTPEAVLDSAAEAVIVEGHIYQNLDYAEQALKAGKHVLLEKPAGVDLAQLERIHSLAKSENLALQMAYMWRYNPAIHEILRLARAGTLGEIFQYRGHIPKPREWHPQLAREFSAYRGGVYFEMAGHLVDLMVALMGEPLRVHPVLGRHYGDREEVDNAVVVHEFESGLGVVDTTAMQMGMARRLEVHGTGGTALHAPLGSSNLSLFLEKPVDEYNAGWEEIEVDPSPESPSLLRELAACIHDGKEPDYTLAHDLLVQQTLFEGCGIGDGKALKNPR